MDYLMCSCPPFPPAPSPPAGTKGSFNSPFGCVAPTTVLPARRFAAFGEGDGPCGAALGCPHIPPAPSPPAGTKGSLNSPFGFFAPNAVLLALGCDSFAREVRSSERARSLLLPFGRAEQRSGAWIRAGACLSEASLRLTPSAASSARQPEGSRSTARLSFAYFSLAKQRKVSRPPGRNPVCGGNLRLTPSGASSAGQPAGPRSSARLSFAHFSLAKQRKVSRPPGRNPVSPNSQAKLLILRKVTQ